MRNVGWRAVARDELAGLLAESRHVASSAIGAATVYRVETDGFERIVVALPGGEAIVIEEAQRPARRRRRQDDS